MKVVEVFDYRNAKSILESVDKTTLSELESVANDPAMTLRLGRGSKKQQDLSRQLQEMFVQRSWKKEVSLFTIPELRYDLFKGKIPVEIEIGHERLVYAVFFKFLADYSARKIEAGVLIATSNPRDFGHSWHNSVASTRRKIESIERYLLVPILVLGLKP